MLLIPCQFLLLFDFLLTQPDIFGAKGFHLLTVKGMALSLASLEFLLIHALLFPGSFILASLSTQHRHEPLERKRKLLSSLVGLHDPFLGLLYPLLEVLDPLLRTAPPPVLFRVLYWQLGKAMVDI